MNGVIDGAMCSSWWARCEHRDCGEVMQFGGAVSGNGWGGETEFSLQRVV